MSKDKKNKDTIGAAEASESKANENTAIEQQEVTPVKKPAPEVPEAEEKKPKVRHNTASAAAMNAEDEEVDIRRVNGQKETVNKGLKIPYEKRKNLYGLGFIAIWAIGSVYCFLVPLIKSIYYSFCKTEILPGEFKTTFIGWENYKTAFTLDQRYPKNLVESLGGMVPNTIIIIIFSLFIAILLNQKFRGRTLARAIFFLPVIVATGPVISIINGDMINQGVSGAAQFSSLFETDLVDQLMNFVGIYNLNQQLTETIQTITSDIFNLVWKTGIQILIFLAALQNIPHSAREAAMMEGATSWEFFWKITFPYISPMILANLIYTIIDAFIDPTNPVMEQVLQESRAWNHGYSASLAWVYFIIIAVALSLIVGIISKFIYYEVE